LVASPRLGLYYYVHHNTRGSAKLKEKIARVKLDPETGQFLDVRLFEKGLRFKCKRCGIYCCKLGGPCLTREDIKQIESAGYEINEFVEDSKRKYGELLMTRAMKNRKDGSCIFLRTDGKRNAYECLIYEIRPILCRLFPFEINRIDIGSFLLKTLPCNGLNDTDGELVNKRFIVTHLLENNYEHLLKFIKPVQL
jgi:Fe-S-cluster containining protein